MKPPLLTADDVERKSQDVGELGIEAYPDIRADARAERFGLDQVQGSAGATAGSRPARMEVTDVPSVSKITR